MHEDRLLSSLHARIRNYCSNLKWDLFVNHLSETNLCEYCNVSIVPGLLTNVFKCFTALAISIP